MYEYMCIYIHISFTILLNSLELINIAEVSE